MRMEERGSGCRKTCGTRRTDLPFVQSSAERHTHTHAGRGSDVYTEDKATQLAHSQQHKHRTRLGAVMVLRLSHTDVC